MNKYKNRIGKQFKSYAIKDLSLNTESRTISGYAAVFGNIDRAGDILVNGCFSKSIRERGPESNANDKIIMLWMHNTSEPIGRITKLYEDNIGLYFEAVIDDIDRGNQSIKQLESGTLNQFSIGYEYVWDKCEYDSERDAYIIKEVILYEISVVSIGCNGETVYLGLKSMDDYNKAYADLQSDINSVCKGLSISKRQSVMDLITKSMSLSSYKPDEKTLLLKEADGLINKDFFKTIKIKDNE